MIIKRNKLTYEQITAIRELYGMGVNAYQIAKKLGIASSVARYHIKSMLSPPPLASVSLIHLTSFF
jgi:hypothetical protein